MRPDTQIELLKLINDKLEIADAVIKMKQEEIIKLRSIRREIESEGIVPIDDN